MIDIQNQKDFRNIDIKKVGVKNIKYPIIVLDRARGTQPVNATINMYVNLPHHFKGTHMSRFVEVLNDFKGQLSIKTFQSILEKIRQKLHAHSAHMEIEFPYFLEKTAPVSKAKSLMEYRCLLPVKITPIQPISWWELSSRSLPAAPVPKKSASLARITSAVWRLSKYVSINFSGLKI